MAIAIVVMKGATSLGRSWQTSSTLSVESSGGGELTPLYKLLLRKRQIKKQTKNELIVCIKKTKAYVQIKHL